MSSTEIIEIHDVCDTAVVHPHGQIQGVKDCWCKVYHVFGKNIELNDVQNIHLIEDVYCYYLKDGHMKQQPPNQYIERKFRKKVFGPAIMYRKGDDLSMEKARNILQN
jgi:hypothetical protein